MATEPRIANADLSLTCARCGRAYPRMYKEAGLVVCRVGSCRKGTGLEHDRQQPWHPASRGWVG